MAFTVFRSPEEWSAQFAGKSGSVLSVGNFDGLHLGHQKILKLVHDRAISSGLLPAVITFDPHPLRLLRPEHAPPMIQTLPQRLAGFETMGIEAVLVLRFDRGLSEVSPEGFIERILIGCINAKSILVGANFWFGHRGAGNVQLLEKVGKLRGFEVEIVPPVEFHGRVVSSTAVRAAIMSGNVADACALLGRPFSLTGEIHPGAGRGRRILFPTLNLAPDQELLPKLGVYATESLVEGNVYRSVTNVGTRPTFNGRGITVESNLFGFSNEITNGRMEVRFQARLRDEQKFSGPEALREQIARDISATEKYFAENGMSEQRSLI